MLNSIKTLKGYSKATLNVFFYMKKLMMTEMLYMYDRIFVLYQNFTTWHVKIVENSRIFSDFCLKFQGFPGFYISQIPGFSRVPGNPVFSFAKLFYNRNEQALITVKLDIFYASFISY